VGGDVRAVGAPRILGERDIERLLGLDEGSLKGIGDARYCVAQAGGKKWVYSAGLAGDPQSTSAAQKGRGALAKEMAILLQERIFDPEALSNRGLLNSHHYIHDIVGANYNEGLNVPRDEFYSRLRVLTYPSATGIGMFSGPGDMTVEFTAASGVDYEPVIVQRHGEAYQYTANWLARQAAGKTAGGQAAGGGVGRKVSPPKFSRAVYLREEGLMILSGTASVERGKGLLYGPADFEAEKAANGGRGVDVDVTEIAESAGLQNLRRRGLNILSTAENMLYMRVETSVEAQALTTIRNKARLMAARGLTLRDMAQVRDYYTFSEDEGRVRGVYERVYGNIPMVFVRGPVCYRDWNNESEGYATKRKEII
jgi:hypothetical protein